MSTGTPERVAVTALGRLEPGWGVLEIGAPPGDRIEEMRVLPGQEVVEGEVLAVLQSHDERTAQVAVRQAQLAEAQRRLERARLVGPVAVEAREATVRRLEADLKLASADLTRTHRLVSDEVVPERDSEFQGAVEAQARSALDEAQAALEEERRSRRLAVAEAEAALARAQAQLSRDEAALAQSILRAPVSGAVLDVMVFAGEATGDGPVLRLGEVSEMYAVAEVYETDARFVREGQRAVITSPALPRELHGWVEWRSRLVHKNDVLGIDPAADTDTRVMETRIRIDETGVAAEFVHLQVDVEIDTQN
ncbi:MAG: efflux RND transporter periplasmic adaptor subunit [Thermoanaerobaculia bacterium]|nr:efflux RND transporter periplasmic adaptor subunit [Thermoanaerobaculia bacterium]